MDPDDIAFRKLLRQAETDPELAAELSRLIVEARPLREILSLASGVSAPASGPAFRTPGSADDDR